MSSGFSSALTISAEIIRANIGNPAEAVRIIGLRHASAMNAYINSDYRNTYLHNFCLGFESVLMTCRDIKTTTGIDS